MSDTSDPSRPPPPPPLAGEDDRPAEGDPLSPEDLEAVFMEWESKRDTLPPAELSLDNVPLTAEELALDHEVARTPEAMIARARVAARYRLLFLVMLTAVGLGTLWLNREDASYYMLSESDQVDFGDARERWRTGERPGDDDWPAMEHNSWVRFENGILTEERESQAGTFYFFEPMMKMIVVTKRALPEKSARVAVMDSEFTGLVMDRWIFPADLSAGFSGQGRLIRASEAPKRYRAVIDTYVDFLRLADRVPEGELWLFLDDANPTGQIVYVLIYGVALFIILLSLVFYLRARQKLLLLEDSL